jgi:tRNA threonylcarbamoyladenosine biosynthesis protein TsaB
VALILAFDTATKHCAVVLARDGAIVAQRASDEERFSHAEKLNVFIEEVLIEAALTMKDVEAVGVGIGPGSYTGLRIGLSAAKGLCFALDVPLLATGMAVNDTDALHPMIDARRMEVFTGVLDAYGHPLGHTTPVILDDAWRNDLSTGQKHIVFGDGADKAAALWEQWIHITHVAGVRPSVRGLAARSLKAFQRKEYAELARLVPQYGKEANVTRPGAK